MARWWNDGVEPDSTAAQPFDHPWEYIGEVETQASGAVDGDAGDDTPEVEGSADRESERALGVTSTIDQLRPAAAATAADSRWR